MERPSRFSGRPVVEIEIGENLDKFAAKRFRDALRQHALEGRVCHIVDIRTLELIQSTTLAGLIGALRAVRQYGGSISLVVAKPRARRILTLAES